MIKRSTQIPNVIFDRYLPYLKESELKILLVVIRQTYGLQSTDYRLEGEPIITRIKQACSY